MSFSYIPGFTAQQTAKFGLTAQQWASFHASIVNGCHTVNQALNVPINQVAIDEIATAAIEAKFCLIPDHIAAPAHATTQSSTQRESPPAPDNTQQYQSIPHQNEAASDYRKGEELGTKLLQQETTAKNTAEKNGYVTSTDHDNTGLLSIIPGPATKQIFGESSRCITLVFASQPAYIRFAKDFESTGQG